MKPTLNKVKWTFPHISYRFQDFVEIQCRSLSSKVVRQFQLLTKIIHNKAWFTHDHNQSSPLPHKLFHRFCWNSILALSLKAGNSDLEPYWFIKQPGFNMAISSFHASHTFIRFCLNRMWEMSLICIPLFPLLSKLNIVMWISDF